MGAAVMGGGIQFGLSTLLPSPAPSGTDSSLQQQIGENLQRMWNLIKPF